MAWRFLLALVFVLGTTACGSSNKKKDEDDRGLLWGTTSAVAGAVWETGKLVAKTGYAVVSTGATVVTGGAKAVSGSAATVSEALYGPPATGPVAVAPPPAPPYVPPSSVQSGYAAPTVDASEKVGAAALTASAAAPAAGKGIGGALLADTSLGGTGAAAGGNIVIPATAAGPLKQKLVADELERFLIQRGIIAPGL